MASEQYRRELVQLAKDIDKVRSAIEAHAETARAARASAALRHTSAERASSKSSRDGYLRQANQLEKKAGAAEKSMVPLRARLGTLLTRQASKASLLRNAELADRKAVDRQNEANIRRAKVASAARQREDETRRKKEKSSQQADDRDTVKRRRTETEHARMLGRLSSGVVRHVLVPPVKPEMLRILYLTASPGTPGLDHLRVDVEVNHVLKAIRAAKHAGLIDFQHRPAATVQDLTDGLNDVRPHVVHFSGHAGDGLLFDLAPLRDAADHLLRYDAVANLLRATDQRPELVVLNACNTVQGVERLLEVAPVVIGTNEAIGDIASTVFAVNFYAAIAAAQSIAHALAQAREMMVSALQLDRDVLSLATAQGVDAAKIKLVRPAA